MYYNVTVILRYVWCQFVADVGNLGRDNCMVTVLDRYTSSFHWAQQNFAAIWLRPQWYLYINSFLSDSQNGGLGFVTGGDYSLHVLAVRLAL